MTGPDELEMFQPLGEALQQNELIQGIWQRLDADA
jgi:hypothetical protein